MASVKVAVRVRPLSKREEDLKSSVIIQMDGKKTMITNTKLPSSPGAAGDCSSLGRERVKQFTYDQSYWSVRQADPHYTTQQQVFVDLGEEMVEAAYSGYNACIFAYGQTGSGKTYTMMGSKDDVGLIPRICQHLFTEMKDPDRSYKTQVSYLEIYNERVRDLLREKSHAHLSLKVREHPKEGPYVQDLSKHLVASFADIHHLIDQGNNNRTTAATNMNDVSSRSHAIFTIFFTQAEFKEEVPSEIHSKINLVDLAGSERADASGATGDRLKEGGSINKSLVTLGNVISTLADLTDLSVSPRRSVFVPYRDSILTWLLKDSLGGNSKTIMMATISPAECNYAETLSTLRYASRAKKIVNKPLVNEDPNVKLIRELREENKRLKELLESQQDWFLNKKKLNRNEERLNRLTELWTDKWQETTDVLEEHKMLALRKEGQSIVLDSELPYLLALDDNILSTGMKLYHLKEGEVTVGSGYDGTDLDIVLEGPYIEERHCVFSHRDGEVVFVPSEGARCYINSSKVNEPTRLKQGAVIKLGKYHLFRFNHPGEAAQLREQLKENSTEDVVKVMKDFKWTWTKSTTSLTDSAVESDLELEDSGCSCSEHRIEQHRKELEELREEQLRCEAKRLAQLAEQEANRKQLAEEKVRINLLAKEAICMKEEAKKVQKEIKELGSALENQAKVQLEEQHSILENRSQLEEEKQQTRDVQEDLSKEKEVQEAQKEVLDLKERAQEEEFRNDKKHLQLQRLQNQQQLEEKERSLERAREVEVEVFRAEAASMRSLVDREVDHIRHMAGLEPEASKLQKEADNESEALDDIESDRLQLKDLCCPLAPILPDKYLSEGETETDWAEVDSKLDRLSLADHPVDQWSGEQVLARLVQLVQQVEEVEQHVCRCLCDKYSSVLSTDDNTEGLGDHVLSQFSQIRPLYADIEKVVRAGVHQSSENQQCELLRECDHRLGVVDRLLQTHQLIQSVLQLISARHFLIAIERLDAVFNVMANLEAEYEVEVGAQKCLQVELCLLREKLLYGLSDAWSGALHWTLPIESRRVVQQQTVRLEVRGECTKEGREGEEEGQEQGLSCTVQAMASVGILQTRLQVLCERVMRHVVQPLVRDANTLLQVVEEQNSTAQEEHLQQYLCVVSQLSSPATLADPLHVLHKLSQVLSFIHRPLANILLPADTNTSPPREQRLTEKIGALLCNRLFECIYTDCLCHAVPKTAGQFEAFGRVVNATEEFQALLIELGFMLPHQATLMDYLNNVSRLFASVKSQEMVKKAHKLLNQRLDEGSHISEEHPLGVKPCSDGEADDQELFVQTCKREGGTLNLKLPRCQVSTSVRSLVSLAYGCLQEGVSRSSCSAEGVAHLSSSLCNVFELYCDLVPSCHKDSLRTAPLLAALHHNNCMFLAHHVVTMDRCLQSRLPTNTPCQDHSLQELTVRVRKLGNEHLSEHISLKKEELCDALIEAQGFECVADDHGESAESAVKHTLVYLRSIALIWKEVLPTNVYCKAVGSLLQAVLEDLVESVLSIEEFSVEDCDCLKELLSGVPRLALEYFTLTQATPTSPQTLESNHQAHAPDSNHYPHAPESNYQSQASESNHQSHAPESNHHTTVSSLSSPHVLLHDHVSAWPRFTELVRLLGSGLQQISDRWADGKGPLALHLTETEVRQLVLAMFENTSKRQALLTELRRTPAATGTGTNAS